MAFSLKDIIWNLYGGWEQRSDTIKNATGKGVRQRYNELIAEEYDENTQALIDGLVSNLIQPFTMFASFLPYWEEIIGAPISGMSIADRRKFVAFAIKFNQAKGTITGLKLLYARLGVECEVLEVFDAGGFDAGGFDVEGGFDKSECQQFCGNYTIQATGLLASSGVLTSLLLKLAMVNNPINAMITEIVYLQGAITVINPNTTTSFGGEISVFGSGGSGSFEYEIF